MKYIRTKNGIYDKSKIICSAFREEYCSPNWNEDIEKYLQEKIIKEANTLEDLCDEFIEVWGDNGEFHWYITRKELKRWKTDNSEIYGAMWTKNGLIFVAKRNAEKELELL